MLWAREMRGISSMAKLVILRSRISFTRSGNRCGDMKPTTMLPSAIWLISSSVGGWTLNTTSALPSSSARSSTKVTSS